MTKKKIKLLPAEAGSIIPAAVAGKGNHKKNKNNKSSKSNKNHKKYHNKNKSDHISRPRQGAGFDSKIRSFEEREYAGARNIYSALTHPFESPPIRFPMPVGGITAGTVPLKETMKVDAVFWGGGTIVAGTDNIAGFAIINQYVNPVWRISGGTGTAMTWASAGNPSNYTAVVANANYVRVNAISISFLNYTTEMFRSARMYVMQFAAVNTSGVWSPPVNYSLFTSNPLCRCIDAGWMENDLEFINVPSRMESVDFQVPSWGATDGAAAAMFFMIRCPTSTTGVSSVQNMQAIITLHYEMIPLSSTQPMFDTKISKVGADALQEVVEVAGEKTNNAASGLPGIVGGLVSAANDVVKGVTKFGKVGQDVWDYASSAAGAVSDWFSGALTAQQYSEIIPHFLRYGRFLDFLFTHPCVILTPPEQIVLMKLFWREVGCKHKALDSLEVDDRIATIFKYAALGAGLARCRHLARSALVPAPIYYIDVASLHHPWSLSGNNLLAGPALAATVDANRPRAQLVTLSWNTQIVDNPPILQFLASPTVYELAIFSDPGAALLAFLELNLPEPPPLPQAEFQFFTGSFSTPTPKEEDTKFPEPRVHSPRLKT